MLKKTEETYSLRGQMDKNDYSVHEMLTFASLVEEEATAQVRSRKDSFRLLQSY
jgi:UPF0755 protein